MLENNFSNFINTLKYKLNYYSHEYYGKDFSSLSESSKEYLIKKISSSNIALEDYEDFFTI